MTDLDAVEDYAARLQTGSPRAGDLVNVPTALLDASWVSSVVLGADTVLVGTVQSVGYGGACSSVLVSVECYPDVLEVPGDHPCVCRFVRPPAVKRCVRSVLHHHTPLFSSS